MIALDHIALAAASLERGIQYVCERTGLTLPFGGQHPNRGTHNALSATGSGSYLEIIAPDPGQPKPQHPRMFRQDADRDLISDKPRIQTFLLRTDDIARHMSIFAEHGFDLGQNVAASRGALNWNIALHPDGSMAADGAAPCLLQWPAGPHVSETMDNQGLTLTRVTVVTPQAAKIAALLTAIGFADDRVIVTSGDKRKITATYQTPDGGLATLGD